VLRAKRTVLLEVLLERPLLPPRRPLLLPRGHCCRRPLRAETAAGRPLLTPRKTFAGRPLLPEEDRCCRKTTTAAEEACCENEERS
jgi:hypothetical protein